MSAAPPEILDFLRAQFKRVHQRFDGIERQLDEHTTRLGALERGIADLWRGYDEVQAGLAGVNQRLDNLDRRVQRIERRLELIEAPVGQVMVTSTSRMGTMKEPTTIPDGVAHNIATSAASLWDDATLCIEDPTPQNIADLLASMRIMQHRLAKAQEAMGMP